MDYELLVANYQTAVSEKKTDKAYQMLDPTSLPNKTEFEKSINSVNLSDVKITKSEKVDDSTYKVYAGYLQDNRNTMMFHLQPS